MNDIREQINKIFDDAYSQELNTCKYHTIFQRQKALNEILALIKEAGWVQLDEDQGLPENPFGTNVHLDAGVYSGLYNKHYSEAQWDMLKAGFRKVKS